MTDTDHRAPRFLSAALCFIVAIVAVMQTVVVPIVGTIQAQLGVSTAAVGWVLTANLLAAAVSTPILGRLADIRGKRNVLLGILVAVLIGSLLCAATESFALLIAGRILQGLSFALFPVGIAVLRDELPPRKLIGAMGLFSGTLGVGGAVGMVLTGALTTGASDYRRVFWFVVGCNIVGLVLAALVVPARARASNGRIDWVGAALLALGLSLVLLSLSQGGEWGWASPATIASGVSGIAVLVGWLFFERRIPEPLVPTAMLTRPQVLALHIIALLVGLGMFVNFLATALFVQASPDTGYGFGATVLKTTTVYMLPGAVVGVVAAAVAGRLIHRFGARGVLAASCAVGTLGFVLFAVLHDHTWQLVLWGILLGLFVSLAYATLPALIVAEVPPHETGVANSINSIARSVGSSLSSAFVTALLATMAAPSGVPRESAFIVAFAVSAAAAAVATVLALTVVRRTPLAQKNVPANGATGRPNSTSAATTTST